MTGSEKLQLIQQVTRELGDPLPGIERTPGICGGHARIAGSRIPVWLLEQARRVGITESEILGSYPSLRAEDLVNAWAYVRTYHDEIEQQIDDNEAA